MMAEQIKQMVDEKIASKKVFIFSKTRCPYCLKAKKIFIEYKLTSEEYEVMEIEDHPECAQIQLYLKSITGASSVPRVFINGKCIGGGDDTARLHSSGELAKLLA